MFNEQMIFYRVVWEKMDIILQLLQHCSHLLFGIHQKISFVRDYSGEPVPER